MNYICSTQNRAAPGYASALKKLAGHRALPTFTQKQRLLWIVQYFLKDNRLRKPGSQLATHLGKKGKSLTTCLGNQRQN